MLRYLSTTAVFIAQYDGQLPENFTKATVDLDCVEIAAEVALSEAANELTFISMKSGEKLVISVPYTEFKSLWLAPFSDRLTA